MDRTSSRPRIGPDSWRSANADELMAPLVVFALWTRRTMRAAAPGLAAIALAALTVVDVASPLAPPAALVAGAALVLITAQRAARRAKAIEGTLRLDLELG